MLLSSAAAPTFAERALLKEACAPAAGAVWPKPGAASTKRPNTAAEVARWLRQVIEFDTAMCEMSSSLVIVGSLSGDFVRVRQVRMRHTDAIKPEQSNRIYWTMVLVDAPTIHAEAGARLSSSLRLETMKRLDTTATIIWIPPGSAECESEGIDARV